MKKKAIVVAAVFDTVNLFLRDHINALKDLGYDVVVVVSPSPRLATEGESFGVRFREISVTRTVAPLRDLLTIARLSVLLWQVNPELVHFHTPKAGLLTSLVSFLLRVRIRIFTLHGSVGLSRTGFASRIYRFFDWLTCRLATSVWCVSESLRAEVVRQRICPEGKSVVLGDGSVSGVDQEKFALSDAIQMQAKHIRCREFGDESFVIGFVGRLNRDKGVLVLLEAFRKVLQIEPTAKLLFVGSFDSTASLTAEERNAFQAHPAVRIVGHQADVAPFMAAMDVLAVPSFREGFGMVCIEAASLGVPVVGSDIIGLRDAIVDGETGLLFPVGCTEALAEAILSLITFPARRKELGDNGRVRVSRKFSRIRLAQLVRDRYENEIYLQ